RIISTESVLCACAAVCVIEQLHTTPLARMSHELAENLSMCRGPPEYARTIFIAPRPQRTQRTHQNSSTNFSTIGEISASRRLVSTITLSLLPGKRSILVEKPQVLPKCQIRSVPRKFPTYQ